MTRSAAGNRFRQRKLSTKQSLAVVRESQIDSTDDDAQRSIPQIDTGVERQEEIEHHLQAAISASQAAVVGGKVAQIFIPTPDASKTVAKYETLYPKRFSQPSSYIRFSSTVEDCCGPAYCMDSDDDKFLQKLNSTKRSTGTQCSEDTFEEVMQHFEETVAVKQPYLAMDVSQILPYEELEAAFEETHSAAARAFAKYIYPHWKEQKIQREGKPIMPTLRFELGQDKDDGDPYVCFRRREVRQVRKTRRTDAQSTEKLKKLRQEMEMARSIVADVLSREKMRKEQMTISQGVFELRASVKDYKRKHNLRGEDEDLYDNNKVRMSRKPTLQAPPPAPRAGQGVARVGSDLRPQEAELTQLNDAQRKKVEKWRGTVETGQQKRSYTNLGVEDYTELPITPPTEITKLPTFEEYRGVQTFFLPSPPPSASPVSSPSDGEDEPSHSYPTIRTHSAKTPTSPPLPSYRRRIGRGGRIMIDRRNLPMERPKDLDPIVLDRFKYDSSQDEFPFFYPVESNGTASLQFRSRLLSPPAEMPYQGMHATLRRQTLEHIASQGHPPQAALPLPPPPPPPSITQPQPPQTTARV